MKNVKTGNKSKFHENSQSFSNKISKPKLNIPSHNFKKSQILNPISNTSKINYSQNELNELNEKNLVKKAIAEYINENKSNELLVCVNLNSVKEQYKNWLKNLPRFTPFYAVKSNNDSEIIETLVKSGASFDCASMGEIKQAMELGVHPSKIIYANPCKPPHHLQYARSVGVTRMTFDNKEELMKIKNEYSDAELVLRINGDDSGAI